MYPGDVPELTVEDKRKLLAQSSLFRGLEPSEVEALVPVTRTQVLQKKDELFHKGDEGSQLFLVVHGKLKAYTTSESGDDVAFSIMGPGEVFGEIALLGGTARTASVSAIEPCQLLVIERRDLLTFLRRNAEAAIRLLRVIAIRTKQVSELVEDTLFLNLPLRLAKKLLVLAKHFGEETDRGVRVDLKLSQEEWGDLIGATRESVNQQLGTWREEGLVSLEKGYIVIHRPEGLDRIARAVLV